MTKSVPNIVEGAIDLQAQRTIIIITKYQCTDLSDAVTRTILGTGALYRVIITVRKVVLGTAQHQTLPTSRATCKALC